MLINKTLISNVRKIVVGKVTKHQGEGETIEDVAIEFETDNGKVVVVAEGNDIQIFNPGE